MSELKISSQSNIHSSGDDFAENPRKKSWLRRFIGVLLHRYSLALLVAAALSLLVYTTVSESGFIKNQKLLAEQEKLQKEIAVLEDENRILSEKLERLKNDPAFVEDEARKKLGLVRPGEKVYRLSEEPDLAWEEQK